jgi:hypothetical protein
LIDLEDLGWQISYIVYENDDCDKITISLSIVTEKIPEKIYCQFFFNKEDFITNYTLIDKKNIWTDYKLSKYDKHNIDTAKECTNLLINILDYNNGKIRYYSELEKISYLNIYLDKKKVKKIY